MDAGGKRNCGGNRGRGGHRGRSVAEHGERQAARGCLERIGKHQRGASPRSHRARIAQDHHHPATGGDARSRGGTWQREVMAPHSERRLASTRGRDLSRECGARACSADDLRGRSACASGCAPWRPRSTRHPSVHESHPGLYGRRSGGKGSERDWRKRRQANDSAHREYASTAHAGRHPRGWRNRRDAERTACRGRSGARAKQRGRSRNEADDSAQRRSTGRVLGERSRRSGDRVPETSRGGGRRPGQARSRSGLPVRPEAQSPWKAQSASRPRWASRRGGADSRSRASSTPNSQGRSPRPPRWWRALRRRPSCALSRTPLLATPIRFAPITVMVGPVPVVLVPTLQLSSRPTGRSAPRSRARPGSSSWRAPGLPTTMGRSHRLRRCRTTTRLIHRLRPNWMPLLVRRSRRRSASLSMASLGLRRRWTVAHV